MKRTSKFLRITLLVFSAIFAGKALSQSDTLHPKVDAIISGGILSDFSEGLGGIAELSVIYQKQVFGISFSSVGAGNVVTYRQGGSGLDFFASRAETSYSANLNQVIALHYGNQLTKVLSITAGIAWVLHYERSAINQHQDPGGFFTTGDYRADLVEHQNNYVAIPITVKAHLRFGSWIGMIFHAQMLANLNEIRFNGGVSIGFGNFQK